MSRCAHGASSTTRCRNCAAVIEPPLRLPVFFISANCESICLSYSGPSGMRQTRSPVSSPTLVSRSANSSLLENKPAYSVPRQTMIPPGSVARCTMNFGLNFFATYQSTSASTSRPSASVLMISMVWPDIDVTISPGRCALPSGMFSTRPMAPTALTFAFRAASAPHIALHVLHAGGALDGNAAGIETDALADKGNRLIAPLAAIPAHDHDPSRLRRALRHSEQRAHAEFRHGLDVEDLDDDAELAKLAGAMGEFHGKQHVR